MVDDVERRYKKVNGKQTVPGVEYRTIRERPLLMLHLLDVKDGNGESIFEDGTAAYGISFPGTPGAKRPEKLVQYVVNTVWWNNMYSDTVEDSTDDLGIDE